MQNLSLRAQDLQCPKRTLLVRRRQEGEATKRARTWLTDFVAGLTKRERETIRRGVRQGINDIGQGHYHGNNADGLRSLANLLGLRFPTACCIQCVAQIGPSVFGTFLPN